MGGGNEQRDKAKERDRGILTNDKVEERDRGILTNVFGVVNNAGNSAAYPCAGHYTQPAYQAVPYPPLAYPPAYQAAYQNPLAYSPPPAGYPPLGYPPSENNATTHGVTHHGSLPGSFASTHAGYLTPAPSGHAPQGGAAFSGTLSGGATIYGYHEMRNGSGKFKK